MSGNPILMMSSGSIKTIRTTQRPSRKARKDRLSHRSSDRSGAVIIPFDDLYPLFEAEYPWEVKLRHQGRGENHLTSMLQWCANNFGKSDYFMPYVRSDEHRHSRSRNVRLTTRARWNHLGWDFYFKTQEDATLFKVCHC